MIDSLNDLYTRFLLPQKIDLLQTRLKLSYASRLHALHFLYSTKMESDYPSFLSGSDASTLRNPVETKTSLSCKSRPCHALERLFVDCNVRFAVGIAFSSELELEAAQRAVKIGLRAVGLDRLAVDEGSIISLLRDAAFELDSVLLTNGSLTDTIDELVARDDVPASGCVKCYLVQTPAQNENGTHVVGVVINANHAICDGRLLQACIESIVRSLKGEDPQPPPHHDDGNLGDLHTELKILVSRCPPQDPKYLTPLHKGSLSKIAHLSDVPEFIAPHDSLCLPISGKSPLRGEIEGDVVASCRARLAPKQATVTGFMMACWIQAIAEVVSASGIREHNDSIVSISCLVGLHSQLPTGLYTNGFGTVTVSGEGIRRSRDTDESQFAARLIDLASACTKDLRCRILRGEALCQGLSLCEGEFESSGCTPGTIELSNHGVYRTTGAIREVVMQQRFDGYDGVSVLMFSESHTGLLRLLANAGAMYR
jgi:hypothetical protein